MADAYRAKFEQECPDCGASDFVEDASAGDLICRECGVVVEAHTIDERSEWRTFTDKEKDSVDPNRVGGPSNHLLSDGGLTTVIAAATKGADGGLSHSLNRLQARANEGDRSLLNAFREITKLCDKLGLVQQIKSRSQELFKQAHDRKAVRGARSSGSVYLAVIYIACRVEGMARTFKEICAADRSASKKEIGRVYKAITRELELLAQVKTIHASAYMRRFGSRLGLAAKELALLEQMADAACPKEGEAESTRQLMAWDSKSPITIAASLILLFTSLPQASAHPTLAEIVAASGVAEVTIRGTYRDLYRYAAELLPRGYNTPEDIAALPVPVETSGGTSAEAIAIE